MLLLHLWTKHKSSRWASVRFRTTWNDCFEVPEQLLKKEKKVIIGNTTNLYTIQKLGIILIFIVFHVSVFLALLS